MRCALPFLDSMAKGGGTAEYSPAMTDSREEEREGQPHTKTYIG